MTAKFDDSIFKPSPFDVHFEFYLHYNMDKRPYPSTNEVQSVYIPSIHKKYNNSAIFHVFDELYGMVTRIDTVQVKTKDGAESVFKSAFVHYLPHNDTPNLIEAIKTHRSVRINPNLNTDFMRRHFNQPNPRIRAAEFWLVLPNNTKVPNTKLSLAQINEKMNRVEPLIVGNEVEIESLKANRGFFLEIEAKQARRIPAYQDTSINIHQLAHNIDLMEQRVAKTQALALEEGEVKVSNV